MNHLNNNRRPPYKFKGNPSNWPIYLVFVGYYFTWSKSQRLKCDLETRNFKQDTIERLKEKPVKQDIKSI